MTEQTLYLTEREQRQVRVLVNGFPRELLETMPRRQAEEAPPPIPAPPASAGASDRMGDIPSPGCLSQCLSCLWLLRGWHFSQPPNRVNIHEQQSRPRPAGALHRLQNVTVRSAPERHFPHSSGATRPIWPQLCVNRLLCRTCWMWPLGTREQEHGVLRLWLSRPGASLLVWSWKKQLFRQRLGCKLWWVPSLSMAAYKAGAFSPLTYHTAPFQSVKFCGL